GTPHGADATLPEHAPQAVAARQHRVRAQGGLGVGARRGARRHDATSWGWVGARGPRYAGVRTRRPVRSAARPWAATRRDVTPQGAGSSPRVTTRCGGSHEGPGP